MGVAAYARELGYPPRGFLIRCGWGRILFDSVARFQPPTTVTLSNQNPEVLYPMSYMSCLNHISCRIIEMALVRSELLAVALNY